LYNYARYVEECLDSLARQTQADMELVVVDDCSTDDSLAVVLAWLDRNDTPFVAHRVIAHTTNMGLPYARNTAFEQATSDRVFVMDADNALYPRAIESCVQAMAHSGAAGAYTQLEFFGDRQGLGDADFWSKERFKPKNYIDAMALVSKAAWRQVGGYSQLNATGWEDYDFWCKFVEHGLMCTFVPELLCRYRTHAQSMSATETNPNAAALILQMSIRHPWLEPQSMRFAPLADVIPPRS
ncbi:MAG: glycosyltransferase family 2 protein, partial [Alphaproteobacteria bacterium]|nr:glycosyltransferase family 2 protein [Alphaproteobacteria bacterium]